jgi:hypothetical protein
MMPVQTATETVIFCVLAQSHRNWRKLADIGVMVALGGGEQFSRTTREGEICTERMRMVPSTGITVAGRHWFR